MSNTQRRYERDRERRDDRDRRDRDRRDDRADREAERPGRVSSAARRVFWVVGAVGVTALVISLTTSGPQRPPAPEQLGSLSAKRVTEHVADNAVVGAALEAERAVAARDGRPATVRVSTNGNVSVIPSRARPGLDGATLRLAGVRSRDAHVTKDAATADAVEQAREQLGKQLALLDPPITRRPSLDTVRDKFVFPNSARTVQPDDGLKAEWAKAKIEPNRVWVEVDVEVTAKQLQQLRGEERTLGVAKVVGAIVFALVGLAGFFRLDALTKGHLTVVLAVGVALLGTFATVVGFYLYRAG